MKGNDVQNRELIRELIRRTDAEDDIKYEVESDDLVVKMGILAVEEDTVLYDFTGPRTYLRSFPIEDFEEAVEYIVDYIKKANPDKAGFRIYDADFAYDTNLPRNQEELAEIIGQEYEVEEIEGGVNAVIY